MLQKISDRNIRCGSNIVHFCTFPAIDPFWGAAGLGSGIRPVGRWLQHILNHQIKVPLINIYLVVIVLIIFLGTAHVFDGVVDCGYFSFSIVWSSIYMKNRENAFNLS